MSGVLHSQPGLPGTEGGPGFSQLLNYQAMVGDGVMVLKDHHDSTTGPLLAGFWYDGVEHENANAEQLASIVRAANHAFKDFATGWMLHFETMRRAELRYDLGYFEEAVDQLIDEERHQNGRFWRVDCAVFLTYTPSFFEGPTAQGLQEMATGQAPDGVLDALLSRVESFKEHLRKFERSFGQKFAMRRMRYTPDNDELLQALNYVLTGRWHPCRLPSDPVHLDAVLAREVLLTDKELVHEDDCVAVVGITQFPESAYAGLVSELRELNVDYRIGARFIFLDNNVAQQKLSRLESKWTQVSELLVKMKVGSFDRHADERASEVSVAIRDLNADAIRFGHFTFVIVLRAPTQQEANQKASLVIEKLRKMGFTPVLERKNRMEAFLGSLPGHGKQNLRLPLVNTVNLGMLCDLDHAWPGEPSCPSKLMPKNSQPLMRVRNWHGGYFDLNLHQRDVAHTLIVGMTGGGKTTLVAHLTSQFMRYAKSQVVAFDYGNGLLPLTMARVDGAYYAIGEEDGPQLCPLAELDTPEDLDWAEQWIGVLCSQQNVTLQDGDSRCIRRALHVLASIPKELGTGRRMTDLLPHLQNDRLESVIEYYVSGLGARVLNGASTSVQYGRFTTFELGKLLKMPAAVATPTLLFLFRQVEKRASEGAPLMIPIAEAWSHFNHPVCAPMLAEWLVTLRKKNAFVVMDLQQLGQIDRSPIADDVFSSCPTRIILPSRLTDKMRAMLHDKLGLSEKQIQEVHSFSENPDAHGWYLFTQGKYSRWFTMNMGATARAFCAAGSKPELALATQMARTYGEAWPEQWLRHRGLTQQAVRFAELRAARGRAAMEAAE